MSEQVDYLDQIEAAKTEYHLSDEELAVISITRHLGYAKAQELASVVAVLQADLSIVTQPLERAEETVKHYAKDHRGWLRSVVESARLDMYQPQHYTDSQELHAVTGRLVARRDELWELAEHRGPHGWVRVLTSADEHQHLRFRRQPGSGPLPAWGSAMATLEIIPVRDSYEVRHIFFDETAVATVDDDERSAPVNKTYCTVATDGLVRRQLYIRGQARQSALSHGQYGDPTYPTVHDYRATDLLFTGVQLSAMYDAAVQLEQDLESL